MAGAGAGAGFPPLPVLRMPEQCLPAAPTRRLQELRSCSSGQVPNWHEGLAPSLGLAVLGQVSDGSPLGQGECNLPTTEPAWG